MNENNPNEPQCKHYVTRKKRFCRMTVKKGNVYCGEHMPKSENNDNDKQDSKTRRIICPFDQKHTCYENQLRKHLKKCNAKLLLEKEITFIKKGVNLGPQEQNEENKRQLSDAPVPQIVEVIKKVNKIYEDIKDVISEKILTYDILKTELSCPDYGPNTKKHIVQNASLIGHLQNAGLMKPNTCFIEFGAGKGKLSYWVEKSVHDVEKNCVLLVERASLRHKYDNKLDKNEVNVNRIRADIADLVLDKVDCVQEVENLVGITKHLCGDATDLALNCLMNSTKNVCGVVMSFCCHHKCHWNQYTGKSFIQQNDLSISDFDIICGLVSWATCGTGKSREKNKTQHLEDININNANIRETEIGLTKIEKEKVGKKAKLILDYGRYNFLEKKGFNCSLYYYVTLDVSLENVCIVACK